MTFRADTLGVHVTLSMGDIEDLKRNADDVLSGESEGFILDGETEEDSKIFFYLEDEA